MSDKIDGKFTIQQGDGISHAIVKELGLNNDEAKKLNKSIWTKIFTELETGNTNNKIYRGGNDGFSDFGANFKVRVGQVVEISSEIWNKIVGIVEKAIGKTIVPKTEEIVEEHTTKLGNPKNLEVNLNSSTLMGLEISPLEDLMEVKNLNKVLTTKGSKEGFKEDYKNIDFQLPQTEVERKASERNMDMLSLCRDLEILLNEEPKNLSMIQIKLDEINKQPEMLAEFVKRYSNLDKVIDLFPNDLLSLGFATTLEIKADKLGIDITKTKSTDKDSLDYAKELAGMICDKLDKEVEDSKSKQKRDVGQVFTNANVLLATVANMEPKPEVITMDDGSKKITLNNGQDILVKYKDGEISKILISYDTTPDTKDDNTRTDGYEVEYTEEKACYDNDHSNWKFEGSIKEERLNRCTYDFEAIKKVAEKIFASQ